MAGNSLDFALLALLALHPTSSGAACWSYPKTGLPIQGTLASNLRACLEHCIHVVTFDWLSLA